MFFTTYESVKGVMAAGNPKAADSPTTHMLAGACGEVMACLIRVPTENVKQKMQAGLYSKTMDCVRGIVAQQGAGGFYMGYFTTVCREIPFSVIQFPLYEGMKRTW